jgi:5-methylcytosine-specific restriction endonuclease McrA
MSGKMMYAIRRMTGSAKEATGKRTVSETKKKYVAAQQQWKCHSCGCILPAWFEVDHIQRVEHGGSNHPDNLVALCRNCHGQKTSFENL